MPFKSAGPLDFSAELAAKLGVKVKGPVDSDVEGDNEEDLGEGEKRENGSTKDDLFSASVNTSASISSKGSKKRNKKHKKPKSRSGSRASHESVSNVFMYVDQSFRSACRCYVYSDEAK